MSMMTPERTHSGDAGDDAPSPDVLRSLYTAMVRTRQLDLDGVAMQRGGIIPGYAPMRGQEAAQVGSAAALDVTRDFAFPTYRELGVAVAMGVDPVAYFASHRGSWHGGLWNPAETHLAPLNAVVGAPVLHAMGWAMGARLNGTDGAAIAYFGDGASSQGDVHEAMNFAGVYRLPVVFFCQNNGWAISVPTESQVAGGSVAARAAGYGIAGDRVDGNDVVAVYRATEAALLRARTGGGPTVIEAMTYRVGPHSTSDDPGRYRSLDDERSWLARDPLTVAQARMRAEGIADDTFFEQVDADARSYVDGVRAGVSRLGDHTGAEMFDFVFAEPTASILEQKHAWQEAQR